MHDTAFTALVYIQGQDVISVRDKHTIYSLDVIDSLVSTDIEICNANGMYISDIYVATILC